MTLEGSTIVVTGAAQGIGRAIADQVLAAGGRVVALDQSIDALAESASLLPLCCDVADAEAVNVAIDRAIAWAGSLSGLVNNAGVSRPSMIGTMSDEDWQSVLDINLSGSFRVLRAVGRHMVAQAKAGICCDRSIVNITSDAGRGGTVGQINYGAAKAGMIGMTMSAAREWARFGIRVNAVSFGVVATPMTETIRQDRFRDTYLAQIPLGRFGEPEEVAMPVIFMLSNAASYVTGQTLSVNGGYRIAG